MPKEVLSILKDKNIDNIAIKVVYKNWEEEEGLRTIIPLSIFYGSNDFHKEEQWLMKVWDLDKKDYRIYSLRDILEWKMNS